MAKTKSWVLTAPGKMALQEFDIPDVGTGDLLLKVKCTSICGTDPHYYLNEGNVATYPLILGHEFCGYVDKIGEEAKKIYGVDVGDLITVEPYIACGHCDYCIRGNYNLCDNKRCYGISVTSDVPPYINGAYGEYVFIRPGSRVFKMDPDSPVEAGSLSSVIGNGYHLVVDKAKMKPNTACLIIGAGALGLATVIAAKESGVYPIVIVDVGDVAETRLALAKELGADYTFRTDKDDVPARIKEITGGKMCDAVMECTGAKPCFKLAFDCIKKIGTIVLLGMNGYADIPFKTDDIINREIIIAGSIGQPLDVDYAIKTINKKKYPIEKMITHKFPMSKADEAIEFFISKKDPSCIRCALYND